MDSTFVNDVMLPAFYAILSVVIPILAGYATDALRQFGKRQKADWLRSILAEAAEAVDRAVRMVDQTYTEARRGANGKLSGQDAREAFNKAMKAAGTQLGKEGWRDLVKALGGEEAAGDALATMVEASVGKRKSEAVVMPSAVAYLGE